MCTYVCAGPHNGLLRGRDVDQQEAPSWGAGDANTVLGFKGPRNEDPWELNPDFHAAPLEFLKEELWSSQPPPTSRRPSLSWRRGPATRGPGTYFGPSGPSTSGTWN
eukprot:1049414-Pyramimonas_sp.AAC.1